MSHILPQAQSLLSLLLTLMPSTHQQKSLQALLSLFLQAQGHPLPASAQLKSAAALSRFLNHYDWPSQQVIRQVRQHVLQMLLQPSARGRPPHLQLIVDLTCLPKRGKFKDLGSLIRVFNRRRGLQVVVLYLVVGRWRVPWSFRVYRGQGHPSPAQLGLRLLGSVPHSLRQRYRLMVLADSAFGSVSFLQGVRRLGMHALVGTTRRRTTQSGQRLDQLTQAGGQVQLRGWRRPVWVGFYWVKQQNGRKCKRFVICTRRLKGSTLSWWGKRRWQIEGFFKVAKHRFGLHRFGQKTLKGVYRWLIICLIAFVLAHWGYLMLGAPTTLDWGQAAQVALETLMPAVVGTLVLQEVERLQPLLHQLGIDVSITHCKI